MIVVIITMRAFNSSGSADGIKMTIMSSFFVLFLQIGAQSPSQSKGAKHSQNKLIGVHACTCMHP